VVVAVVGAVVALEMHCQFDITVDKQENMLLRDW
jgi:hypothetical protein